MIERFKAWLLPKLGYELVTERREFEDEDIEVTYWRLNHGKRNEEKR